MHYHGQRKRGLYDIFLNYVIYKYHLCDLYVIAEKIAKKVRPVR